VRARILILLALLACSWHAVAAVRVKSFDSAVMLDTDGTAVVTETIVLPTARSELIRSIPLLTPWHGDVPLIVRVLKVEDEHGAPLPWRRHRDRGLLELRIDAHSTTVRITYLVPNAAYFGEQRDQLTWLVTDANFAVEQGEVRVALPRSAEGHFRAQAFSTTPSHKIVALWSSTGALPMDVDGPNVRAGSPGPLPPQVLLTIDVSLDKGVLVPPGALTRAGW